MKPLIAPAYLDSHVIDDPALDHLHRHIGLNYFCLSESDLITLADQEHNAIRWFSAADLVDSQYAVGQDVQFYAREALKRTTVEMGSRNLSL